MALATSGPSPRAWGSLERLGVVLAVVRSIPTRVGISRSGAAGLGPQSVHPHARGDLAGYLTAPPATRRSIPTRVGISPARRSAGPPVRSIPTRVGISRTCRTPSTSTCGPSPRAWGSPSRVPSRLGGRRSIPTRVGISTVTVAQESTTVHPHARGDLQLAHRALPSPTGPSPRAWGSRLLCEARRRERRSIPTRVGISASRSVRSRRCRSIPTRVGISRSGTYGPGRRPVHPHARGDLAGGQGIAQPCWRSIPTRVGISPVAPSSRPPPRSIPTRVGISPSRLMVLSSTPVHPHARGDLTVQVQPMVAGAVHPHARGDLGAERRPHRAARGPSPRAWGSLFAGTLEPLGGRSIPTRVGISVVSHSRRWMRAVHPHARGDLAGGTGGVGSGYGPSPRAWGSPASTALSTISGGPSPRAWGSQCQRRRVLARMRSIPTRVGISVPAQVTHSGPGPSPRAWGSQDEDRRGFCPERSIPTRVGISCQVF